MSILDQALNNALNRLQSITEKMVDTPSDWIEKYFIVPDPRDPITGEKFPAGPLRLASHQKRIINEALARNTDGTLKYSTVVYSAPKKSGKTAIGSAVSLYFAYHNPDCYVYCVANDKNQSSNRIYAPIYKTIRYHKQLNGVLKDADALRTGKATLSNNTVIEAIACDAAGEAGSQPLFVCYSELWAYTSDAKKQMWTEMTIPPTLEGYAMRWVESYAGELGKSETLEQLYNLAVREGEPHPDFLDLMDKDGNPVVWVNDAAGMFCYWDTEPRMVWQTPEYYSKEEKLLSPAEFRRIHRNQWVASVDAFIQPSQWESVRKSVGMPTNKYVPIVLSVDAAISKDCAAVVGVTRDPDNNDHTLVRFAYIFTPSKGGGNIVLIDTVEPLLRQLCKDYNIIVCGYDPYQMESTAQRLRKDGIVWMYAFNQNNARAIADKKLYDMIINRQLYWDDKGDGLDKSGDLPSLYQHITQAGSQTTDDKRLRIVKLAEKLKIDAAVATSMGNDLCQSLNIDNPEFDESGMRDRLLKGLITVEEYETIIRQKRYAEAYG